jgi:hypothetical protein
MATPALHLRLVATDGESVRPRTRRECEAVTRPCQHSTCRYNLSADTLRGGTRQVHWIPSEQPERPSCALDVAELGGCTPSEVAAILGVSKQRVVQIEEQVVRKVKRRRSAFADYR